MKSGMKKESLNMKSFKMFNESVSNDFKVGDYVMYSLQGDSIDKRGVIGVIFDKKDNQRWKVKTIKGNVYYQLGSTFQAHYNNLDYYEVEPEETNYEEWLEESVNSNRYVGRYILTPKTYYKKFQKLQIGKIVGYIGGYRDGDDLFFLVQFDASGNRDKDNEILNLGTEVSRELKSNWSKDDFKDYNIVVLPFGEDLKNITWVDAKDTPYEFIDDEPEDTNYEQWLEEGTETSYYDSSRLMDVTDEQVYFHGVGFSVKNYGFHIGDLVTHKDWSTEVYKIRDFGCRGYDNELLIYAGNDDKNKFSDYYYNFQKIDEPEDTNYEQWLDESQEFRYKVGDKIIVTNPDKDYLSFKDKIGEIVSIEKNSNDFPYDIYFIINGNKRMGAFGENEIELIDSEPEETNYEQWLEESWKHRYNIGDRVLHTSESNKPYYGKIKGYDENREEYEISWFTISDNKFVANANFGDRSLLPFDDEPEETNYEQWNESLILEGLNIQPLINRIKSVVNKTGIASLIAGTLLTVLTTSEAIYYVNKLLLNKGDKDVIINTITKYKDPLTLKVSSDGWHHIRKHETLRLKPYRLGDGKITVGYGHAEPRKKSKYKIGHKISEMEANKLLIKDMTHAAEGVRRMFQDWKNEGIDIKLTQNQFDVLVSMAFNMGVTGLRQSDFIKTLKNKNIRAAAELIKTTGVNDKFPGLASRRLMEYKKFLS